MSLIKVKQTRFGALGLWHTSLLRKAGLGWVAKGKRWHRGPLLLLIIAAHVSELSGGSWWWHGEIGMTSFWRATPWPRIWEQGHQSAVHHEMCCLEKHKQLCLNRIFKIYIFLILCHFPFQLMSEGSQYGNPHLIRRRLDELILGRASLLLLGGRALLCQPYFQLSRPKHICTCSQTQKY